MGIIKTKREFELLKADIIGKIDKLIYDYNEFTRKTSSKYWRVSGSFAGEMEKIKKEISRFEPLTSKELQHDWIRDEVLTDEEKEEYERIQKFNI